MQERKHLKRSHKVHFCLNLIPALLLISLLSYLSSSSSASSLFLASFSSCNSLSRCEMYVCFVVALLTSDRPPTDNLDGAIDAKSLISSKLTPMPRSTTSTSFSSSADSTTSVGSIVASVFSSSSGFSFLGKGSLS